MTRLTHASIPKREIIEGLGSGDSLEVVSQTVGYAERKSLHVRMTSLGLRRIKRGDVVIVVDKQRTR